MKIDIEYLLSLPHTKVSYELNYEFIPCTRIKICQDNVEEFNSILSYVYSLDLPALKRTPSGGISVSFKNLQPSFDFRVFKSFAELTLILREGAWRIQWTNTGEKAMPGKKAYRKFEELCKKHSITLKDYKIKNGREVKSKIEGYLRQVVDETYLDMDIYNVNHIDFNSSFLSNLCHAYPELLPVGEELYLLKKTDEEYKGLINSTIGYFHSSRFGYALANLAKSAINGNNAKIRALIKRLRNNGREPLLINTDGVWYWGEPYHDKDEGAGLGQWRNDHVGCKIIIKSSNAYQYEEEGIIHTVLSGQTPYDKILPREKWAWGDIYRSDAVPLIFSVVDGYIKVGV